MCAANAGCGYYNWYIKYQPNSWRFIFIPDMSGTTMQNHFWPTCVSCSPAALRKTPPVPPVTLLRYPAVNRFKLQQPLRPPQPPQLLPLLKVKLKQRPTEY